MLHVYQMSNTVHGYDMSSSSFAFFVDDISRPLKPSTWRDNISLMHFNFTSILFTTISRLHVPHVNCQDKVIIKGSRGLSSLGAIIWNHSHNLGIGRTMQCCATRTTLLFAYRRRYSVCTLTMIPMPFAICVTVCLPCPLFRACSRRAVWLPAKASVHLPPAAARPFLCFG